MRILQLNCDGSRVVGDELRLSCSQGGWDIAALQEPYVCGGAVVGLGPARVFTGPGTGPPMAAVVIRDDSVPAVLLSHLSDRHVVVVSVELPGADPLYVASVYCKYSLSVEPYILKLGDIMRGLAGKRLLVCADFNARSEWWHSQLFDEAGASGTHRRPWERGEALEVFISEWDLWVLNLPGDVPTFRGAAGGMSNIDVTLASPSLVRQVSGWRLDPEGTSSQHTVIQCRLGEATHPRTRGGVASRRFNEKKADWDRFDVVLEERLRSTLFPVIRTVEELEKAVQTADRMVVSAASEAMPVMGSRPYKVSFWSGRLEALKRGALRLRNRRQRRGVRASPEELTALAAARKTYSRAVKQARRSDWRNFVSEKGVGEPYGAPYRIARGGHTSFQLASLRGSEAVSWEAAAGDLLEALFPADAQEGETPSQAETRTYLVREDAEGIPIPEVSSATLECLVRSFKPGKAPGLDRIEVRALQRAWPLICPWYTLIFSRCMELGHFPVSWKMGRVCVLRKAGDRDPSDPGAYRPLCLLGYPGKLLEKVIVEHLSDTLAMGEPSQHGFRKGRSTTSAILELQRAVGEATDKYVLGIFVDIRGAFDNVWWPAVMQELRLRGCSPVLFNLLLSYFDGRSVVYEEGHRRATRGITKGCPQGSVLGPRLWNVLFDAILRSLEVHNAGLVAYADDLVVLVRGSSRASIEARAAAVVEELVSRCGAVKLQIAGNKTVMMLLKGRLVGRNPVVRVGGERLAYVRSFRYLGVTFGERWDITPHILDVSRRAWNAFAKVCRLAGSEWGIGFRELVTLYKGLFLGILLYGVASWAHRLNKIHWNKLGSIQRKALLKVNRAYGTSPTVAMPVLAGVLPVHLESWRRWAEYRLKKRTSYVIPGVFESGGAGGAIPGEEVGAVRERMVSALMAAWQDEWDTAPKGRLPHRFLPSVATRLERRWLHFTHEVTQFVVGHGEFAAKLAEFRLIQPLECACGREELADHVLQECPRYQDPRVRWGLDGIALEEVLRDPNGLARLEGFAREVLPILRARPKVRIR